MNNRETTLKELMVAEMRDVYHAERQLTKALPKLAKAATSADLREAFETHLEETQDHVTRLEKCFKLLGEPVKAKPCTGMQGIVEEGSELIKEKEKGPALDAGLIAGAQRAEHYEMAAYGSLTAWAKTLGEDAVAEQLEQTLEEEKAADEKLSELAEGGINEEAANGTDGEQEADSDDTMASGGSRRGSGKARGMRMAGRSGRR